MTGYHLSIGYNSKQVGDAWAQLLGVVDDLREQPDTIFNEVARELGPIFFMDMFREVIDTFKKGSVGCTVTIIDQAGDQQVMLAASGGGPYREIKEATRRAFCRLVLLAMHQKGIEVNVVVA